METPRDIIVSFQNFEEKNLNWGNMRGKLPIKYEDNTLQIFVDPSQETLGRRMILKPLLE